MAELHPYNGKPLPSYPYLKTILAQCKQYLCLHQLADFYLSGFPYRHPCRLACLEYTSTEKKPRRKDLDMKSLAQMLQSPHEKSDGLLGKLLIVEDLTPDVIELLGSSLGIEPLFFASHLHASRSEKTVKQSDIRLLPSTANSLKFLTAIYHRPLAFVGDTIPTRLLCDANVRRKASSYLLSTGVSLGFTQRCFSTLITIKEDGAWLGLTLVDPPVRNVFFVDGRGKQPPRDTVIICSEPFQGGYDDFLSNRFPDEDVNTMSGPQRDSLFDDLIYYWTKQLPFVFEPQAPTLLSLSYYPLKIIAAEWMNFANLMHYAVEDLEYATEDLSGATEELCGLEYSVRAMQSWRRRSADTIHKIRLLTHTVESLCSDSSTPENWKPILDDFELITARVDMYRRRFDAMIPVLTSFFHIVESRRSLAETKNATRLTYLALIFVPLTFVSSLFSMTGDIAPGKPQFWIYFAVAIPLIAAVFLVARR